MKYKSNKLWRGTTQSENFLWNSISTEALSSPSTLLRVAGGKKNLRDPLYWKHYRGPIYKGSCTMHASFRTFGFWIGRAREAIGQLSWALQNKIMITKSSSFSFIISNRSHLNSPVELRNTIGCGRISP